MGATPRWPRTVAYDHLPIEAIEAFHALPARHAQELIELLDTWLARHHRSDGANRMAERIEGENEVRGHVTAVDAAASTLVLFGRTVRVTDLTELRTRTAGGSNSSTLADVIANMDRVEVRAFVDGGTIVAERVEEVGSSGGDRAA